MPEAESCASNTGTDGEQASLNEATQPGGAYQEASLPEDPSPRSPKRRRLSPAEDDVGIDFEAAAARALAISLGADHSTPSPLPIQQHNGANSSAKPSQSPAPPISSILKIRLEGLPLLDGLATQILSTLAKMSHTEIGEMLFGPPSQRRKDYQELKSNFEQAKRPYLTDSPFVNLPAVGLKETSQVDILRKTNMATFMASIFSGAIGLRIMDMNFVHVFVPENGRLLKAQASIYLELKTQAFIAAKRTAPDMLNQVMLELFPNEMEKTLLARRPGAKSLAPSEQDFLKRLQSRRDILYTDMRNNRLENVEGRYRWDDFSREVNSYLSKIYDQSNTTNKDKSEQPSPTPVRAQLQQGQMEGQFSVTSQPLPPRADPVAAPAADVDLDFDFDIDSFMAKAARAAEIAMQGGTVTTYTPAQPQDRSVAPIPQPVQQQPVPSQPHPQLSPSHPKGTAQPSAGTPAARTSSPAKQPDEATKQTQKTEFQQYKPVMSGNTADSNRSSPVQADSELPHKSQTAPTQVLYERARLVTTNKVPPSARKPNPPSHRRPWTNEEENALMTGLDQVKGPHWSQILAMYGPGGTINEALKDRNQVQLKDKARNLKLFFLKANIEVPYYLKAVTGDLKTRAPGQAEKREAKERERLNIEGDDLDVQQDDLELEDVDELDVPTRPAVQQEEYISSTLDAHPMPSEQQAETGASEQSVVDDSFDQMEAMLAKAAANAQQSFSAGWS